MTTHHRIFALACFAAGIALAGAAQAQVHKCTGPDGKSVFQGEPCDGAKPAAPAAKSPAPPRSVAFDHALKMEELRKVAECDKKSGTLDNTMKNLTGGYQDKIDDFRRECLSLGFRLPDTPSNIAHNQAIYAKQVQDYEKEVGPRPLWARSAVTPPRAGPRETSKASRCYSISRALEDAIPRGSLYSSENAAFIVEFRTQCQELGYRFPDSRANVDHNRARVHELTSSQ